MSSVKYSISDVVEFTNGELINEGAEGKFISDILIDSRRLVTPEDSLFFALVSKKNNGHKYLNELYEKGVRNFVVSENIVEHKDANYILVENTLDALQKFSARHRLHFEIPVIGITGSNGKTIVKEWLFQLMSPDTKIIRSPKSYNSQIGVPLSVWQMRPGFDFAVFEAGISEPDEMDRLRGIINPTIGIFTNIGPAHSENFITINQKAGEKLKLFTKVDTLIYCPDYSAIQETIIKSEILGNINTFTWSRKEEQDVNLLVKKPIRNRNNTLTIKAIYRGDEIGITIPFTDDASLENAIHCWATMLYLGYDNDIIAQRMTSLQPIAMRLEMKEGVNHCSVINDSYNSDINSLNIALDFLNQQNQHKRKSVILSDILQSGQNDDDLYEEVASLINNKGIDKFIGIGKAISNHSGKFSGEKAFYPTTRDFLQKCSFANFQNETILLKGARIFEFEQISQALQQKAHETILEINLNALINNLDYYRRKLKPETKIMAMVKAFSYGSGSFEIANILQYHHVDYLVVAYADEGVELRKSGIKVPIMVMNPEEQSFDDIIKHNLEPEIYNFRSLHLLEKAIRRNIIPENKPIKIHIKLDTGMHRLGFLSDEIDELIANLSKINSVYLQSVFSHLASSEDSDDDDFTDSQVGQFKAMAEKIKTHSDHHIMMHILNSAGITRFPQYQFDMVRLGISLYGVSSVISNKDSLENVSTLRSTISQIKKINPGETIGYNRTWKAEKEMIIAIVPIGYADGLDRKLSNGKGRLYIKGVEAPFVGSICMDMCMIDITGIDVNEGDDVIVFNSEHPITILARDLDTIPYEVLTSISRRVKRVYYHE
jgi:alanine racemase